MKITHETIYVANDGSRHMDEKAALLRDATCDLMDFLRKSGARGAYLETRSSDNGGPYRENLSAWLIRNAMELVPALAKTYAMDGETKP